MRQLGWREAAALAVLLVSARGLAFNPKHGVGLAADRAFFKEELRLGLSNRPLEGAQQTLAPQAVTAWQAFKVRHNQDVRVWLDARSAIPTNVLGRFPLLPGDGVGNQLSLSSLSAKLGRKVGKVDAQVVGDAVLKFIAQNVDALGVNLAQLGVPRVTQVNPHLWQVHIPQQVAGVPVRHARLAATISHGNLVLLGTETWANVETQGAAQAAVLVDEAVALGVGLSHLGQSLTPATLWKQPALEWVPYEIKQGDSVTLSHKLAWVYGVPDQADLSRWKMTVDAATGELLESEDANAYAAETIRGGVYPLTNTEVCPNNQTCGTMQVGYPMPWADTGQAAPNNFTNGAGVWNNPGGTATTTLSGKYVKISDACGAVSQSSTAGSIDMGGTNGQHDCAVPAGGSVGNTASARSSFYEINRLAEMARGWLPSNTWVQSQLTSNVNINNTCNAFWNGTTINFYRSGGGCRNTGEIGGVFDHEWGHGLDDFDANGSLSNSSEAYADIAAIYRLQTSCVGHGFFQTAGGSCGQTADGTGNNANEAQTGATHCDLNCSGVRDADWDKHADHTPDTPVNFVCTACNSGSGPCGKQVHCAAAPVRQAAWDLVARDLRQAPFNYDSNTAFMIGNRLFYQGSGNVGTWHACNCTGGTSDGCGATNGYMQWLAADDDNGNLADGTPHMTAIHAAFNRHGIACGTPTPTNGGCAAAPTTKPQVTTNAGAGQVALTWASVPSASSYWVLKTEGYAGCDFGKALVATVSGTSYTDAEVTSGRQYCYNVVAVGSSNACFSEASACVCATPGGGCTPPVATSNVAPANGATNVALAAVLDWNDAQGATQYEVQVATDAAFTNVVRGQSGVGASAWTVSPELATGTTYYWRVRSVNSCGTSAYSAAFSFTTTTACSLPPAPSLVSPANAATGVALAAALDWSDVAGASSYEVQVATDAAFGTVVRSASSLTASGWTVTPALANSTTYYWRARAVNGCGPSTWAPAYSFTTQAPSCAPTVASFDGANFRAPLCTDSGCGCDTGTLVDSRGTQATKGETNAPNTVGASCADGNAGTYHSDESVDRVAVVTTDALPLAPGKAVEVRVTVWCYSTADYLEVYYASNAASPTWTQVGATQQCAASGVRTFTVPLTLASSAGRHAVRAQLRYGGSASACTSGTYNDRDDIVFQVGQGCTPPGGAPVLASPANGATGVSSGPVLDWGDVSGATTYEVQVATDSAFGAVVRSATGLAASTWTVTPALNAATTYYWRARATNSCGSGAYSGGWSFTTATQGTCTPAVAVYNATQRAPGCSNGGICGCDSGTLVDSRGTMASRVESNQPNTLGATCADGNSGTYHSDESVDRVVLRSVDGGPLTVGKQVRADVTVWCYSNSNAFDLYYATDAAAPTWTQVGATVACTASGQRTFSQTFNLAANAGQHAIRAQLRYGGTPSSCTSGAYNDRDDLTFAVTSGTRQVRQPGQAGAAKVQARASAR